MRRLMLVVVLAGMAIPAGALKRVTEAQLEQTVAAANSTHKPDAEIAHTIAGMELSERLSEGALGRLYAKLKPGSRTAQALELLADRSAFLDLPASELPATAAPDEATQKQILEAVRSYVAQTLRKLPNFLATRTLNRYNDSPQEEKKDSWPVRAGLHLVDTSSQEISVREESEGGPGTKGAAVWEERVGLTTAGEFGSTLGTILADTAQGTLSWSHWEQTPTGLAAVFRYSVPKAASHFEVIGSVQRRTELEPVATPIAGRRGIVGIGVQASGGGTSNTSIIRTKPGYHGSMWVDPASGTILRITMEADPKDSAGFKRAAILVEYGQVEIGGSRFVCPVRSLALSMAINNAQASLGDEPTEWLNETLFTGYHHFASTTRILTDAETPGTGSPADGDEKAK